MYNYVLEPAIRLIEDAIEKIPDTLDDESKALYKSILKRDLIIIKSIDMSKINMTGKTIEEFEEYMSKRTLVPIGETKLFKSDFFV